MTNLIERRVIPVIESQKRMHDELLSIVLSIAIDSVFYHMVKAGIIPDAPEALVDQVGQQAQQQQMFQAAEPMANAAKLISEEKEHD